MGGMLGRLFREFAVTLSVAILVSLVVSLTTIPMLCARVLQVRANGFAWLVVSHEREGLRDDASRICEEPGMGASPPSHDVAADARHHGVNGLSVHHRAEGIFPQQDTGRLIGNIQAAQDISFQAMRAETV